MGPLQFLNSSSYCTYGTNQSSFTLDQVKQFILESGSVPDQGTKESSSSLYNPPHRGKSISSPNPSTLSDHFKNYHCRCFYIWSLVASSCSLWIQIFRLYRLFILLFIEETVNRMTPSWRQPLFQILINLPLILEFTFQ